MQKPNNKNNKDQNTPQFGVVNYGPENIGREVFYSDEENKLLHRSLVEDSQKCFDTELAYKLGGVEINLDNYINDGVWNAGLWWEDFDKWWNSLPVEEQKRIHYKLFNADAYPQLER